MLELISKAFDQDAVESIKRIIKPVVDDQEHEKRIKICLDCKEYSNNIGQYCKICRCYIPVKTKLKGTNCPINKW